MKLLKKNTSTSPNHQKLSSPNQSRSVDEALGSPTATTTTIPTLGAEVAAKEDENDNNDPNKTRYYDALSDDGSSDSGESFGIQIPQGYLSKSFSSTNNTSMDISSLSLSSGGGGSAASVLSSSSGSSSGSSSSQKIYHAPTSSVASSKLKKNNNEVVLLLKTRQSAVSPRVEQNNEDLRRLVALAKHPNPQAAARAVAATTHSSNTTGLGGPPKRRSSKSSSRSNSSRGHNHHHRRRSSSGRSTGSGSRRAISIIQGSDGRPIEVDAETGRSYDNSDDSSSCSGSSSSDGDVNNATPSDIVRNPNPSSASNPTQSNTSPTNGSNTTLSNASQRNTSPIRHQGAANLGSSYPRITSVGTSSTEEEDMETTSDPTVWEDRAMEEGHGYPVDQAQPQAAICTSPSAPSVSKAIADVMEWMSILLTPPRTPAGNTHGTSGGHSLNESAENATDLSLASKEQYSTVSACTDKTPRTANLSPTKRRQIGQDIESGHGGALVTTVPRRRQCDLKRMFSKRSTVAIVVLCVILFVAIVTTIAAAIYSSKQDQKEPNPLSSFAGVPRPAPTAFFFTQSPSLPPSSWDSSAQDLTGSTMTPSLRATLAQTQPPSFGSTAVPTRLPTLTPTMVPTTVPTLSRTTYWPTIPSSPTPAPTTEFSTADFVPVGEVLSGTIDNGRFGHVLATSSDGNIIAVGEPLATVNGIEEAGMVQVYEIRDGEWVTRGPALFGRNEGDQFGSSVSMSSDGQVLIVSEPTFHGPDGDRSGNVRAFSFSTLNQYEPLGQDILGESAADYFGVALASSSNGLRIAVGAPYHDNGGETRNVSGNVRVFEFNIELNTWEQIGNALQGSVHLDWFGWSLDMSHDGNILAVGAPRNLEHGGYVRCYQLDESSMEWQVLGEDIQNSISPVRYDDSFGQSVSVSTTTSLDDNVTYYRVAIGSPGKNTGARKSGMAAIYELASENRQWGLVGSAIQPDTPGEGHQFGYSVDLWDDVLALGVPGWNVRQGQVHLYQYTTPFAAESRAGGMLDWQLHPTLDPTVLEGSEGNEEFGSMVRLVSNIPEGVKEEGETTGRVFTLSVGSPASNYPMPGKVRVYQLS
jgi:hypothetical protein